MDDTTSEPRSWTEAETASIELSEQLRVLRRMVAAARNHLERLSIGELEEPPANQP